MEVTAHYVIQNALTQWYLKSGTYCSYPDICHHILAEGNFSVPSDNLLPDSCGLDEPTFLKVLPHKMCELFATDVQDLPQITEFSFYGSFDINVLQLFYNISEISRAHSFFTILYVYEGECVLITEQEQRHLKKGDLFILSPGTSFQQKITGEEDITFLITIRKSTFQSIFSRLLTQENPLAGFFRTVLYSSSHSSSPLWFSTGSSPNIRQIIRNLTFQSMIEDVFTNDLLINYVSILFSELLRNHSNSLQYETERKPSLVPQILYYMKDHYQELSLQQLAEIFHYSSAYLSVLLKESTGYTYTEIINKYRMTDAANHLTSSTKSIAEIAELTGLKSPDTFTKAFRRYFGTTPSQYRLE